MGAPSYNNFQNLITFSRGTNATLFDSTGKLTFGPNNLLVNTATLSTQTVNTNLIAGCDVILSFRGTGSVAISGGFTGTLAGTGASDRVFLKFTTTTTSLTFTVTGTVTEAQLERVTYQTTPSTYNASTASQFFGPRLDYDPVTLALRGLLVEEQRTSAITGVTNFNPVNTTGFTTFGDAAGTLTVVSDTAALTASGLIGACTSGTVFKMDNSAGTTPFYARTTNAITLGVSTTWAMSVYARGSGTFTIDVNAGTWTGTTSPALTSSYQRISSVGSSNTSNNQFRLAAAAGAVVYFILMQAEQGAFPTSIIPNTGASSVTRNADVATMSGSQFTPWYNGTQGTLVVTAAPYSVTAYSPFVVSRNTATTLNDRLDFSGNNGSATNAARFTVVVGGSTQADTVVGVSPGMTAGTQYKFSAAYAASNFVSSSQGILSTPATSGSVPTGANIFEIGNRSSGSAALNGHIRSITYYPRRLSNTQLQRLTA